MFLTIFRERSVTHTHKLDNIASMVAKLGKICFGSKFVSGKQNCF